MEFLLTQNVVRIVHTRDVNLGVIQYTIAKSIDEFIRESVNQTNNLQYSLVMIKRNKTFFVISQYGPWIVWHLSRIIYVETP